MTDSKFPSRSGQAEEAFNPSRLTFARLKRGLKKTDLAKRIGVSARSMTAYEAGEFPPEDDRVQGLCEELGFPKEFFYAEDAIEPLDEAAVSFRAMSKMSAGLKHMALSFGALALQVNEWMERRFDLPKPDVPNFGSDMSPEAAAEALRHSWGLGEQPIKNLVQLLEFRGVRVFSLAIDAREVDAFSLWVDGRPFVFLNTRKSAEHSRFDAAHELGHLILHRHGQPSGQEAERAADAFASAFLMPARSILSSRLMFPTLDSLIKAKRHWGVSVAALNYRLHNKGLTTEWVNRSLCIQIAKAGYRTSEPNGAPREISQIWEKVFSILRKDGIGKAEIARELAISVRDIEELTYGLLKFSAVPVRDSDGSDEIELNLVREKPALRLVS